MSDKTFELKIEEALGQFAVSNSNPCGGTGYYDEGEEFPYRVLFSDGVSESFESIEGAIEAAESYCEDMDQEVARQDVEKKRDQASGHHG